MLEFGAFGYLSKYDTTLDELITEIKGCYGEQWCKNLKIVELDN